MRRFSQHWIVGAGLVAAGLGVFCVGVIAGDPPHDASHATPAHPAPAAKPSSKPAAPAGKPATKAPPAKPPKPAAAPAPADAESALAALVEGNQRWASGNATRPHTDSSRLEECSNGQHPFAAILTCADSRIPVEQVFDQGVGDLFTIRVAGNVAGPSESGTIEYGLEHLETPLLVVMGHTKCGAVTAAASHAEVGGQVATIVSRIEPAVERASKTNPGTEGDELVAAAIRENVWQTVTDLLKFSPVVRQQASEGKVHIVGAIYDIATGQVEWLGEHPWQAELVDAFNARAAQFAQNQDAGESPDSEHAPDEHADAQPQDSGHGGH